MPSPIPVIAIVDMTAKMLSMFRWQSLQLGLPTPFQALRLLQLSWAQVELIPLLPTPMDRYEMDSPALVSPSEVGHLWVSLVQEEWISPRSSQVQVQQSLKQHSAKAVPLGLAWLLAFLRLWWATAWDLIRVGKLWRGRRLETLASGVSSKSRS